MAIDDEKIRKYDRLQDIVRYSQMPKVHNETVAEHSYYVALFSIQICDDLGLSEKQKASAMKMALVHDLPEIYTSDLPSDIKRDNKGLSEILKTVEDKVIDINMPEYRDIYDKLEKGKHSELVPAIVKLADILSVYQYTLHEESLGNKLMIGIRRDSVKRYVSQLELIEKLAGKRLDTFGHFNQ